MAFSKESLDVLEAANRLAQSDTADLSPLQGLLDKVMGYRPEDYLTADKAHAYLKVSRNTFYDLVKQLNIENQRFNNVQIGYYIKDIERIKAHIEKITYNK